MEFLTFFLLVDYSCYPSNNNLMPGLHTRRTVPSHTGNPRKESIYNNWGPQMTTSLVGGWAQDDSAYNMAFWMAGKLRVLSSV